MKNLILFLRAGLLAALLMAIAPPASAADCNAYAGNLLFGTISLLNGGVKDANSTINYGCSASPGERVLLCISMGADPGSGLYAPRRLNSSGNYMAFNLYTDASRSAIWGSRASSGAYPPVPVVIDFYAGEYYKKGTLTLYGRVNATGQTGLPAGTYDTNAIGGWPMSIDYKVIPTSAPIDCAAGGMVTSNSTYYIQAVVVSECRIDSSTTMDFGTVFMNLSQNVDSTSTITVTCNGGQSGNGYHVRLGNGLYASGQQRRMRGSLGYIAYELYRDPQRTNRWGNTNQQGVAGTGTGQPQTLTVYGRVPAQTPPGPDRYADTVVITLSY
ncbi:spore coat protein U domain-containing protein [Castellaniella sp. GW247-6E4]|uniref:Csu type fimbrial protein n=1 Tax=Castellaniella sp. GW247-6E4 TaxID=3140380 RepID=UPI0033155519